jgi:hypothetical protein
MTYGLGTRASANRAVQRGLDRAEGTWGGYQAWRQLDEAHRLELVEKALSPANDRIDVYPPAL